MRLAPLRATRRGFFMFGKVRERGESGVGIGGGVFGTSSGGLRAHFQGALGLWAFRPQAVVVSHVMFCRRPSGL